MVSTEQSFKFNETFFSGFKAINAQNHRFYAYVRYKASNIIFIIKIYFHLNYH